MKTIQSVERFFYSVTGIGQSPFQYAELFLSSSWSEATLENQRQDSCA